MKDKIKISMHGFSWIDTPDRKIGEVEQFTDRWAFIREGFGEWIDFYDDVYHAGCHSFPNCDERYSGCRKKEKYGVM